MGFERSIRLRGPVRLMRRGRGDPVVVRDANRSRYVSSGFWSRVDDEVNKMPSSELNLSYCSSRLAVS